MKRSNSIIKALLFAVPLAFASMTASDAQAQVAVGVGVGVGVDIVEPPAAYIATVQPEYFEGRPVYYYNNYWYYRDGYGRWGYYRYEPAFLRERRGYWVGRGYDYYRPEYWRDHPRGYVRGGYVRPGYVRGGVVVRPAPVHYEGRYHYRR